MIIPKQHITYGIIIILVCMMIMMKIMIWMIMDGEVSYAMRRVSTKMWNDNYDNYDDNADDSDGYVGDFRGALQKAHGDPAPLSAL